MQMTIIAMLIVAGLTYVWLMRGFFSALIHMVCVIAAGAIAFAFWEPVAYFLLERAPSGTFGSLLTGSAWAIALALPFAVSLTILRLVVDKLLPANAQAYPIVDAVGGAVCGGVSAIISAGIIVMSLGLLRVPTNFLGYQPLGYTTDAIGRGSLVRQQPLLRPYVDELTASLYTFLSRTALRPISGQTLADYYPDLALVPASLRMSFGDGKNRNTFRPGDFNVLMRYTVGDRENGSDLASESMMADWLDRGVQMVLDLNGERIRRGYLEGFLVSFRPGAKERTGQVVFSNGQARLVCRRTDGSSRTITLHPIAILSDADPASPGFGRWRFNSNNFHVASVGGASTVVFAFEFAVPAGYTPIALYLKNIRYEIRGEPDEQLIDADDRDRLVDEGWGGHLDVVRALGVPEPEQGGPIDPTERDNGISASNRLPRLALQLGQERRLRVAESGKSNWIVDGEEIFRTNELRGQIPREQSLRIDRFAVTQDIVLVQVDVSIGRPCSLLGSRAREAPQDAPPMLVDSHGRRYRAVGYVYQDREVIRIRYTPSREIAGIDELSRAGITLSASRPDQQLILVFRCNRGAELVRFDLGSTMVTEFDPPLLLDQTQR